MKLQPIIFHGRQCFDTVATPAAMIAGTLTTMAVTSGEMSQFAGWATAIIGRWYGSVVQMRQSLRAVFQLQPQAV